ncbi:MAG: DUF1579 domain-containing protein [Bacteroidota bacterium]
MKRIAIVFCATAFLFSCDSGQTSGSKTDSTSSTTTVTGSDSKEKSEEWVPVDSAAMMKGWELAATPGAPHAILAKFDGDWVGETTMWMAPDAPPMKSPGSCNNKMVMGGRYQESTFKGDMMGMPFEGKSTTGYDNVKKVYVSTWIDNMGTGIMTMEGTWDEATKTLAQSGKMICPANGKECNTRQTIKMVDDKTQIMEMWGPDMKTGKEYKNMEIKFTKKG